MGFQVKETRRAAPVRALIHGPGGVGKSTFGAAAPEPIFLSAEDGLANIDANAVDPAPTTWLEAIAALEWLAGSTFRSVVVDSLDWLEPLCWRHAVESAGSSKIKTIEDFGYGKGYVAALDHWRVFISKLSALHARGKHIVLIAHSIRKPVKNPEGDDYEAWQIKLHEKAAGLVKEWVDVVGFATHEIVTEDTSGRAKGKSTGKRILRTNPTAAYEAKTRYAMPRVLPLEWSSFERAVALGSANPVERLKTQLADALATLGDDEMNGKCAAFLKERGDTVASLSEALETVNAYLAERGSVRKAG